MKQLPVGILLLPFYISFHFNFGITNSSAITLLLFNNFYYKVYLASDYYQPNNIVLLCILFRSDLW